MSNNFGRNDPWPPAVRDEIQQAVQAEVGQIRVAQKVFPSTPFPTGQPVPDDRLARPSAGSNRLQIPEGQTKPFIEISREFCLTQSQVEHEATLRTGRNLARMAARNIAQVEDMIIFHGSRNNLGPYGVNVNLPQNTLGLWEMARSPLDQQSRGAANWPATIFGLVAKGISLLVQATQPGPYALFLSPNIYAETYTPLGGALVTTADRIQPLVTGGFFGTGALQVTSANSVVNDAWAAAANDYPGAAAAALADPNNPEKAAVAAAAAAIGAGDVNTAEAAAADPNCRIPVAWARNAAGAIAGAGGGAAPAPPNAPPNQLIGLGLLVSLGGEPASIYVGTDATSQFTMVDNAGNACFRVYERFQFVVRDPQALIRLEFVA